MAESDNPAVEFAGLLLQGAKKVVRSTARSTRRAGRCAKLRVDIAAKRDQMKKLYTEIGELYYEAHRDDPEGFFVQLFQQLDALNESVDAKQAELDFWKADAKKTAAGKAEDDEGVTVEIEVEPDETEPVEEAAEEAEDEDDEGGPGLSIEIEIKPGGPEDDEDPKDEDAE